MQQIALDGAVIVTTPQDLSLLDASRSLGLFRQASVRLLGLIENMSYLTCPHCGERIEVFHHSERRWEVENEELEVLGRVPMDIAISRGIELRTSIGAGVTDCGGSDSISGDSYKSSSETSEQEKINALIHSVAPFQNRPLPACSSWGTV